MAKFDPMTSMQVATKCPMCDFKYEKKDVKVIENKEGVITLYLSCQKCKSSLMMVIMAGAFGITSISMMSDVMEDDLEKIEGTKIEYDDVLEMHRFLKNK